MSAFKRAEAAPTVAPGFNPWNQLTPCALRGIEPSARDCLTRSLGPCGPRFLRLTSDRRLLGLGGVVLNLPSGAH